MIMPNWLEKRAGLSPHRLALIWDRGSLTFSQLNERSDTAARYLSRIGIEKDQRVAVLSGNSVDFVILIHALIKCGAVLVPLNVRNADDELSWLLQDANASWLLYEDVFHDRALKLVGMLTESIPSRSFEDVSAHQQSDDVGVSRDDPDPMYIDLERIHAVMYTSGTTGRPKGALLTYGNHWWSAVGSALNVGMHTDDRWLVTLPLFHIGGMAVLFRSVIYGMTVVLQRQFHPDAVHEAIDNQRVTIVSVVATMLQRMLDARGQTPYPSTLRMLLAGGGPVPLPLLKRCHRIGAPVVQTYGMTETASQVVTLPPEDALNKPGSSGKPLFPNEIKIVPTDASTDSTSHGDTSVGEIYVRGPSVSPGYLGEPPHTEWLETGDLGYFDEDGYLYVVDRLTDLIISGGENIYPAEVERVIEQHPAVEEAAVIGVADNEWGSVPAAYVVIKPATYVAVEDIIALCKQHLAPYKIPKFVEFVEQLPKNATGKLMRHRLAPLGVKHQGDHNDNDTL